MMSTPVHRYRHLGPMSIEGYRHIGWLWNRRELDDRTMDLYDFCNRVNRPFVLVWQPRRYCQIEASTNTLGDLDDLNTPDPQLLLGAIHRIRKAARAALARSSARASAKACHVDATCVTIKGLEEADAKALASEIVAVMSDQVELHEGAVSMSKQPYHCPGCDKLLGKVPVIGDLVVIETWCKNCKKIVDVVVRREAA